MVPPLADVKGHSRNRRGWNENSIPWRDGKVKQSGLQGIIYLELRIESIQCTKRFSPGAFKTVYQGVIIRNRHANTRS